MIDKRNIACMGAAAFIGILLASAAASPANSQSVSAPVNVTAKRTDSLTRIVPYGDLSLATKQGRNMLYHRVGIAIHEVCPALDEQYEPLDADACQTLAWRDARPQLRNAFDQAKSGSPVLMTIAITGSSGQ